MLYEFFALVVDLGVLSLACYSLNGSWCCRRAVSCVLACKGIDY